MTTENQMKTTACPWLCTAFISCGCSDPMATVEKKIEPELWSMRNKLRLLKCWNEFIKIRFTVASLQRPPPPPLAIPLNSNMNFMFDFLNRIPRTVLLENRPLYSLKESPHVKWLRLCLFSHLIQLFRAPYRPISDAMRDEWVNSTTTATEFINW